MKKNTQGLTQVEFSGDDWDRAEAIARALGYTQTAYTSTSALWGLFCLPDGPRHRAGCIIKTRECGFLFVQHEEDLKLGQTASAAGQRDAGEANGLPDEAKP